ncbi:ATP-binding protein [Pelagicoccus sp. NFK12]|uniref:ATP-binding protein n=1 Tax=Pelagicoccus enzymogenes TaxID=2773457 RepID=A0A927FE02_9BACT|nr:anti-phage-associated helicase HerA [Pelagicoccus enzymogenes]MBD5781653.1 ATP-binding protein [Pelagicoccus enzymogenes]
MSKEEHNIAAEVIAVFPNKVRIQVDDLEDFQLAETSLRIGSYLEISDNENAKLLAVIENFAIEVSDQGKKRHLLEAKPLGTLKGVEFFRGGDELAIPPKGVKPAKTEDIRAIYTSSTEPKKAFIFCRLSRREEIEVPVDGDRFFNKHIAIVGSTGSGKSHTVTALTQRASSEKEGQYDGLNNSHIVIFDIHSEYRSAFPSANLIGIDDLKLPYWLLNSEELEELFLDTEAHDHSQRNVLKESIVANKRMHAEGEMKDRVHFDHPSYFDINEVLTYIRNRNNEKKDKANALRWEDAQGEEFEFNEDTRERLFQSGLTTKGSSGSGTLNGNLGNFINRLENKLADKRLKFLVGEESKGCGFEEAIRTFVGYKAESQSNVTIIDLSGVPFEVLSITVSLISRLLFEFSYHLKNSAETRTNKTPLLLVYEEAHKYAPKSELARYRSSRNSIERIAKEGRKYGVTLLIASQRPSEISETIFSQCNNFIAMRLTNPDDQSYVKRLLPDSLGAMTDTLPTLKSGEALLIGDSIVMPSLVQIHRCDPEPSSTDIPYYQLWKDAWKDVDMADLIERWKR